MSEDHESTFDPQAARISVLTLSMVGGLAAGAGVLRALVPSNKTENPYGFVATLTFLGVVLTGAGALAASTALRFAADQRNTVTVMCSLLLAALLLSAGTTIQYSPIDPQWFAGVGAAGALMLAAGCMAAEMVNEADNGEIAPPCPVPAPCAPCPRSGEPYAHYHDGAGNTWV